MMGADSAGIASPGPAMVPPAYASPPSAQFDPYALDNRSLVSREIIPLPPMDDSGLVSPPPSLPMSSGMTLFQRVLQDHVNYYSFPNLTFLAIGFGVGAALANTNADMAIRDSYQDNMRNEFTDELASLFHSTKFLGTGLVTVPLYFTSWVVGDYFSDCSTFAGELGEWGERAARATLVGFPPMLLMQYVTGGSRPLENPWGSSWRFFRDNNGVSGHAFMGAIPFVVAAQMTDNPWIQAGWYTLSVMPGLSRINDDAHFFSQVALGWWMAFLAAHAVDQTQILNGRLAIVPVAVSNGAGMGVQLTW